MTRGGILQERPWVPVGAVTVLRGLGQVMFQADARAGVLFLAALIWAAPVLALSALTGATMATVTARRAGAASAELRAGIHGFNGALAGIALVLFPDAGTAMRVVLVVAGGAAAGLLGQALAAQLRRAGLPMLTSPFNLLVLPVLALLHPGAGLPVAALHDAGEPALSLLRSTVNGLAQVFFVQGIGPGALVAMGLLIAAPRVLPLAVAASAGGAVLALALGADTGAVAAGLFGYNSVLVALALGGAVPMVPGRWRLALVSALVAVPVHMALAGALGRSGLPGLTVAFVLVAWGGVLVSRRSGAAHG